MKKKLLLCIVMAITLMYLGYAQSCGTHIPPDFFKKQKNKTIASETKYNIQHSTLPYVNLSISVYIAGVDLKEGRLEESLDSLNSAFKPIGVSFTVCSITMLEGDEYLTIDNLKNEKRLTSLHSTKNTINLYFANQVLADKENVCGYTYLPTESHLDYLFIDKTCTIQSTLIHEMGHLFGLLHPHETAGGSELVNESNCSTAGDQVCDTKASPNLLGLVDGNCEYNAYLKDSNGDYYLPTVSNHMAYSLPECRCKFTQGQYARMVEYYWLYLTHLH
jgi:hypothetical protein